MSDTSGRLFDVADVDRAPDPGWDRPVLEPGERLVRVVPDVAGLDRALDYVCPARWSAEVDVGTMVLVDLGPRRVQGWVTELDVPPEPGRDLRPLAKVVSVGPSPDTVELARWAAERWCGRLAPVLKAASPRRRVKARPGIRPASPVPPFDDPVAATAVAAPDCVQVTIGPAADRMRFVLAGLSLGPGVLVLCPDVFTARRLAARASRLGIRCHLQPDGWAAGASGGVVVGARSAVWAPVGGLAAVVVLDEHDESYREERTPTWNARDVAIERARRAGVPCLLVSPTPSSAAIVAAGRRLADGRGPLRRAWPVVDVVDQRDPEPGTGGLFPSSTVATMRRSERVVAILNRKGRAVVLACATCGELVRTADGEHLMAEADGELVAPATGERRPLICIHCTGTSLKRLRLGVTRAAEELAALVNRPVVEMTASTDPSTVPTDAVIMGTSAALHRIDRADVVAFLDLDQELHAPRQQAAEQAMVMIGRAARICGGRRDEARIILQTRNPDHRVVVAARSADVDPFVEAELAVRSSAGLPPFSALALVSGDGADTFVEAVGRSLADEHPAGSPVLVLGPREDGRYLVRADTHDRLSAVLGSVERPRQRLRVEVDPTGV